jgi:hypothetical protein
LAAAAGRSLGDIRTRVVAMHVHNQFITKLPSKGRDEPAPVPGDEHPAANRRPAMGYLRRRLVSNSANTPSISRKHLPADHQQKNHGADDGNYREKAATRAQAAIRLLRVAA